MSRPILLMASLALIFAGPGCEEEKAAPAADTGFTVDLAPATDIAPDTTAAAPDQSPPDRSPPDAPAVDAAGPDAAADLGAPDAGASPWGPYVEARGLIHMHSIYSHDACDGKGFTAGKPNTQCLKELRDALCKGKFDFTFLTDHPSNMKNYTIKQDMLYDATRGDKLWLYGGDPIANQMACAGGHTVLLSVGFESKHMMPLGFHKLPADKSLYTGVTDSDPTATVQKLVKALQAAGAVVANVHFEEKDISAKTVVNGGYDVTEWYNIHANFSELIGADSIKFDLQNLAKLGTIVQKLITLSPFLTAGAGAPHSDLIYLAFLDAVPKSGFTKWRECQRTRLVTGILGSDIHRNVSVDASVCAGALKPLCLGALTLVEGTIKIKIPAVIKTLLTSGGSIMLPDKDRVDSYQRLSRWLENRLLVKKKGDQLELQDALRKGRVYGLFSVFGSPTGFSYSGAQAGGTTLHMGQSSAKGSGAVTLTARLPKLPAPVGTGFAPFTSTEAAMAVVRADLLHTDSKGTTIVQATSGLGSTLTYKATKPGAYHLELFIKPLHLVKALGSSKALGAKEYMWVITNPIFVK